MTYTASREDLVASSSVMFAMLKKGSLKVNVNQTFALADAADAHRALEARQTTGSRPTSCERHLPSIGVSLEIQAALAHKTVLHTSNVRSRGTAAGRLPWHEGPVRVGNELLHCTKPMFANWKWLAVSLNF